MASLNACKSIKSCKPINVRFREVTHHLSNEWHQTSKPSSMNRLKKSTAVASAFKLLVGPVLESSKSAIGFGRGLYDFSQVNTGVHPVDQTPGTHRCRYRLSLSNSDKRMLPSLSESVSDELMLESLIISTPKPLPDAITSTPQIL